MYKFISWNVNGLRAVCGKGFADIFTELDADFFCLQETKMQAGQLDLEFPGYKSYWNYADKKGFITVPNPSVQLAVGTLQAFIDSYLKEFGGKVDYIHGDEVTEELGAKPGNIGFKLPAMGKEQLFKTVMADGVLPRKTFSMGHAADKRYYIEARKIR